MELNEIKSLIDAQGRAFEEFKQANDERIEAVKKGLPTADIEAKLFNISEALSKIDADKAGIEARLNKLALGGTGESKGDQTKAEHKAAFNRFVRKGNEDGLRDLEAKALNVSTDADGGYAVPEELDRSIYSLLVDISPMRSAATVMSVSTPDYKKLVNVGGAASGWVDEDDARNATNTPQLAQVTPFMGEIYANPQATQTVLDDAFFDVEGWLAGEIAQEFAKAEASAFISGNGTKKPKGFLAYTTAATADGTRAFGTIQHVLSGGAGDFASTTPENKFLDMVYALKAGHRAGAVWMMNKATLAAVRKFRDGDGNYLWQPSYQAGQPSTLLGYAVVEAEDMPSIAANSLSIAFGNFKAGYMIVDRIGTRTLRDPYSNKPYVGFYTTKRVGGMVVDSEAIKVMKFAAS